MSVDVEVTHGRVNTALAGHGRGTWARSSASPQGAALIAAARYLGCSADEVDLELRKRGDSVSGEPTVFEARRRGA